MASNMPHLLCLLIGTRKGAFIAQSDAARQSWTLRGPFCDAWPINHVIGDAKTGIIYAGGGNPWFGPAVWQSPDCGASWTHSSAGLQNQAGDDPVTAVWSLAQGVDGLYVGVEPAGLFRSANAGHTFAPISGLQAHPSRPHWNPGAGGLILHSIVPHPSNAQEIWVAISAAGVFYTDDGGQSWHARNRGTRADYMPEDQRYPEFGQCVHSLVMASNMPERLYQQNHCGMYRSEDGGVHWHSIEAGLPSSFGFPAAAHPRDPATLYLFPLNGDTLGRYVPNGQAAVWHTTDAGAHWQALRNGLPAGPAYFGVLRQALTTDPLTPAGIYFGTNTGALYGSADEGEHWHCIAQHLPTITSVETMVMSA
ncbi:exo-alpha-sialidase [Acidiphilium sp. MT5]